MNKFTHLGEFLGALVENIAVLAKAKKVVAGILAAHSPRQSDIAREMGSSEAANYKYIQRFLQESEPKSILLQSFQEKVEFVIGDPTEMPRPQARKTDYVGTISDGQTRGYWLLFLATSYKGRAIPCDFVSYSSPNDQC